VFKKKNICDEWFNVKKIKNELSNLLEVLLLKAACACWHTYGVFVYIYFKNHTVKL